MDKPKPKCGDPMCPCQDGDCCHYEDHAPSGTKAWPRPKANVTR
jgi:hypothetical protein